MRMCDLPGAAVMVAKVKMVRVKGLKLPRVDFRDLFRSGDVQRAITAGIIDNVLKQKQADGSRLKRNAPSTLDRKRRQARPLLSLVDKKRRFVNASNWKTTTRKNVLRIRATGHLAQLIKYVGEMGYTGYIGVSATVLRVIKKIIKDDIKRILKKAK